MITPGTILIEEGTPLPDTLRLESEAYPSLWMSVKNCLNPYELETQLKAAGWTFLYMASHLNTAAYGFDRRKMIHTALRRMIAKVKAQKCNCLEIDDVATRSFLGMPYVSVSAHPRNIQKGLLFSETGS